MGLLSNLGDFLFGEKPEYSAGSTTEDVVLVCDCGRRGWGTKYNDGTSPSNYVCDICMEKKTGKKPARKQDLPEKQQPKNRRK